MRRKTVNHTKMKFAGKNLRDEFRFLVFSVSSVVKTKLAVYTMTGDRCDGGRRTR